MKTSTSFFGLGLALAMLLTGPASAILDLDNNGSSDIWEEHYNATLPANEDPDGDGFTNKQEYDRGTHPLVKDSSEESITIVTDPQDGLQSQYRFFGGVARTFKIEETTDLADTPWSEAGTVPGADTTILMEENLNSDKKFFRMDPQGADPDGEPAGKEDNLDGVEEHLLGTSNTSADTDGDGLGDRFEAAHRNEGFDPNDPSNPDDPNADPDNDGLTNAEEELVGTRADGTGSEDSDNDGSLDGEDPWPLEDGLRGILDPEAPAGGGGGEGEGDDALLVDFAPESYALIDLSEHLEYPAEISPGNQSFTYSVLNAEGRLQIDDFGGVLMTISDLYVEQDPDDPSVDYRKFKSTNTYYDIGTQKLLSGNDLDLDKDLRFIWWENGNNSDIGRVFRPFLLRNGVCVYNSELTIEYFGYLDISEYEDYYFDPLDIPESATDDLLGKYVIRDANGVTKDTVVRENFATSDELSHFPVIPGLGVDASDITLLFSGVSTVRLGNEYAESPYRIVEGDYPELFLDGGSQEYAHVKYRFTQETNTSAWVEGDEYSYIFKNFDGESLFPDPLNPFSIPPPNTPASRVPLLEAISEGIKYFDPAAAEEREGSIGKVSDQPVGISGSSVFINGRVKPVEELLGSATENWSNFFLYDINSDGMIVGAGEYQPTNPDGTNNGDPETRAFALLPFELIVSPVEAEEDDGTPVKYYVSADEAEVPLFADILAGEMDPHDDTVIAWEITDGTGGSLAFAETNFSDGITSNTLTTSTNPGDTYQITGKVKNLVLDPDESTTGDEFSLDVEAMGYDKVTGMELVTAIIEVVPGLTDTINVSTSETELKADGTSELTVTATLTDQFGNTVAEDTWVNWNLEGDGELIEIDNTTDAIGQVSAKLIAGTAAGNQKVVLEADSTVKVETITNTELTSSLISDKSSLDMATGETATLTASFSGVEDGAAVTWHTTKGEIINASSTISGGSATATLRSVETRTGDAIVTAAVGNKNAATHVNFTTSGPISISIDDPVLAGDATSDGSINVPRIDGTSESVSYTTSTTLRIDADESYAGQMATVSILRSDPDPLEGYPMDEINGGSTPNDDGFNHATVSGAVLDTTIKQSGAASIHFDGDDTLTSLDGMRLQIADGLTVNAWVNPETDADGGQIVNKTGEYDLSIDSAGQITFTVTTTTGTHSVTSPVIADVDKWSSVKARYTLSEIALTVNGQTTTQSITGNYTAGVSHVVMGSSFTGNLDEITFSYGDQLTGGLPLNIQGLDGNGQIQLDGSGNATLTVASDGSMGSSDSPELGTVRVSINPTTDAEKGIITAPATQIAIMEAAAGQVKISTSGTDRALTDAEREEYVARMFEKIRETGDLSSGLRLIPGGSLDNRQEFAFRAALIMETNSTGATNTRIIFEATGNLTGIPQEEITSLQDQITRMLMDALQQGSDANFEQHFTDTHGDLIAGLAAITSSNEEAFEGFTRVIDGDIAWQNAQEVYEFGGEDIIEDIGQIAHDETDGPSIGRYMLDALAAFDDLIPSSYSQKIFTGLEEYLRKQVAEGVTNGNITEETAVTIGYGWGLLAQVQSLAAMTNPQDGIKMAGQIASIVIGAANGSEQAQQALLNMTPFWGTYQSGVQTQALYDQGLYFDSGIAAADTTVAAVGDATLIYGAIKVGMSMVRVGKLKSAVRPPKIPASFGKADLKYKNPDGTWNHRKAFQDFYGLTDEEMSGIQVHHAVERRGGKRYPNVVDELEIESPQNLRGIPKNYVDPVTGKNIHQSTIAKEWFSFYRKYSDVLKRDPTKQELLDYATTLDDKYGDIFFPAWR